MNLYHVQLIWSVFLRHECLLGCELLERGVSAAVNLFRQRASSRLWLRVYTMDLSGVCLLSGSGDNLLDHVCVCAVGLVCVCWAVFEWGSSVSLYCMSVFRDVRKERKHLLCSPHMGRERENVHYQCDHALRMNWWNMGKLYTGQSRLTVTAVLVWLL